jgi:predicted N-acetyltransferase YhbS
MRLRSTTAREAKSVADVHRAAFGSDIEADLALALRSCPQHS